MALAISIILIVIAIIAFVIFFKILKGIIKTVFSVILILIIILGLVGVLVYLDTTTLIQGMKGSKEVFIIEGDDLTAGAIFDVSPSDLINFNPLKAYNEEELNEAESKYLEGNEVDNLVLIFEKSYLIDDLQAFSSSDTEGKVAIMTQELMEKFEEKKTSYIIKGVVEDEVTVHPDFISFKILKIMPKFISGIFY